MKSNGRLRSSVPDFVVVFSDGGRFSSDDGTWDDVPAGRSIDRIELANALTLSGFERYGVEWEAVASMPVGRSEKRPSSGEIVALRAYGVLADLVRCVRVTAREAVPVADRSADSFAYSAWRPQ